MIRLMYPLILGGLLVGCAPERHEVRGVGASTNYQTVMEKPVVSFDRQKDVMTDTGAVTEGVVAGTGRSVEMTAPGVRLGPGDYHEKRYFVQGQVLQVMPKRDRL